MDDPVTYLTVSYMAPQRFIQFKPGTPPKYPYNTMPINYN